MYEHFYYSIYVLRYLAGAMRDEDEDKTCTCTCKSVARNAYGRIDDEDDEPACSCTCSHNNRRRRSESRIGYVGVVFVYYTLHA